jgi:NADH:ubiquinone oxidoreductase subunit C
VYKSFLFLLKKIAPGLLTCLLFKNREPVIKVTRASVRPVFRLLKEHLFFQFKQLIDIVVYDLPGSRNRFVVHYLLLSVEFNSRLTVTVQTNENLGLFSIISLFDCAGWLEREV